MGFNPARSRIMFKIQSKSEYFRALKKQTQQSVE